MASTGVAPINAAGRLEKAIRSVQNAQQSLDAALRELAFVQVCIQTSIAAQCDEPKGEDLATRLVRFRAAAGMSQRDLAKASGVSIAQVGRYETGTSTPRVAAITKLAKALNVPTKALA